MTERREPVPARILQLIRDGKAQSPDELYRFFNDWPEEEESQTGIGNVGEIDRTLFSLERAGLIEIHNDRIKPTSLIQKIQQALRLNLMELSARTPGGIYARPLFGKPQEDDQAFEVFVLMPFTNELRPIYEDHIKKVIDKSLGLSVGRADDVFAANSIISDIWRLIYNCKILIADCTHRNPNVFYEIGVAHTVGKPVILIAQGIDDIPFDLRHIRAIVYSYTPPGMAEFERTLQKTVESEMSMYA
ncbi:MAG: hypothetical protein GY719_07900 [bacterium]|nr:hypothetical protein [bacterium]